MYAHIHVGLHLPKGPFTNTCRGPDQKKKYRENFFGAPFHAFRPQKKKKKNQPPYFAMKITGQPHRKHINSIFTGKFVVIFFRAPPLTRIKNFKGPLFTSAPPLQVFANGPYLYAFQLCIWHRLWEKIWFFFFFWYHDLHRRSPKVWILTP